ncbi:MULTISPECIES: hypothetical protein [unclassified Mycobacterium]|uniref:hypothetical protein n=1 Tax=unclassified Mycobacterium TaxID=2642494 RepID=UPI0008016EE7|nr:MULTISPECIES: hypothetical protein [unclassified Mycobacterium]OBH24702.1 hypothetical protein A5693_07395 [Mycobacterium sp. E1319]
MADTFDLDPNTLPPLTKAIRETWRPATAFSAGLDAPPTRETMRAILDAVYVLETRLTAVESGQ